MAKNKEKLPIEKEPTDAELLARQKEALKDIKEAKASNEELAKKLASLQAPESDEPTKKPNADTEDNETKAITENEQNLDIKEPENLNESEKEKISAVTKPEVEKIAKITEEEPVKNEALEEENTLNSPALTPEEIKAEYLRLKNMNKEERRRIPNYEKLLKTAEKAHKKALLKKLGL